MEATGLPWQVERGSRHLKLWVADRMVGILPKDGGRRTGSPNAMRNIAAQIRRAARELRGLDNRSGGVIVASSETERE